MLGHLLVGTLWLGLGLGLAIGMALGLRSHMFEIMPLPLRVLFRAAGLVFAGVLLPLFLILAIAGYSGTVIGDPPPAY